MKKRAAALAAGVGLVAAVAAGGVAFASGNGDDDGTVTGVVADRAMTAALKYAPGARPHGVERDSEDGATWEVEVTRTNGQVVDVRLTGSFELVAIEGDFEDNRPSIG